MSMKQLLLLHKPFLPKYHQSGPNWTKVDLMDQVDRTRLKCYALDFKYYIDVLMYNILILITWPFSPLL